MQKGSKVAVVGCSNGQPQSNREKVVLLENVLVKIGLHPVFSDFIFEKDSVFSGTGRERAEALMNFYKDQEVQAIFDISGGDIANEILPYLDFEVIAKNPKPFWGYSDLTTILNAIYAKAGVKSVLYQIRNLIREDSKIQIENFSSTVFGGTNHLFSFEYQFIQGEMLEGIVVGGNIRCLLKLAGTEYWPDMTNKILLLEAFGGTVPQMTTYLNQLKQMGVFNKINGILLGTFTKMEQDHCLPAITSLVKQYAGEMIPIIKTQEIGHGSNSKGIIIGRKIHIRR